MLIFHKIKRDWTKLSYYAQGYKCHYKTFLTTGDLYINELVWWSTAWNLHSLRVALTGNICILCYHLRASYHDRNINSRLRLAMKEQHPTHFSEHTQLYKKSLSIFWLKPSENSENQTWWKISKIYKQHTFSSITNFTFYDKTHNADKADVELKATTPSDEEVSYIVNDLRYNL